MKTNWKLILLLIASISSIPLVHGSNTVNLAVNVIEPEYRLFQGTGYIHIEDQQSWGKARLYVPETHAGPVKVEIYKRGKVSASWVWTIREHSTYTFEYRKYDHTVDRYICEDCDGRLFRVSVHSYIWWDHQKTYASAYGTGAAFTGRAL